MSDVQMPKMEQLRSPANPADAVMMRKQGRIDPGDTFGQYMERTWGVRWDTPKEEAGKIIQEKIRNGDPMNKMNALAGAPQAGLAGRPPGPQGPAPPQRPGGMAGLLGKLGGR